MRAPQRADHVTAASLVLVRKLSTPVMVIAAVALVALAAAGAGREASASLATSDARAEQLRTDGQHLLWIRGEAGVDCDSLARLRRGPEAWGAVGSPAAGSLATGVGVRSFELDPGALRALDRSAEEGIADGLLIGASLALEMGRDLEPVVPADRSAAAVIWSPPPPAEFAGRAVVRVVDPRSVESCVVRLSGSPTDVQAQGVADLFVSTGLPAGWNWQLPAGLESERPIERWRARPSRYLSTGLGALVGALLAALVGRLERVDDASLLLMGVPRSALVTGSALRSGVVVALGGLLAAGFAIVQPAGTRGSYVQAAMSCWLAAGAAWALVQSLSAVTISPWKVLRHDA